MGSSADRKARSCLAAGNRQVQSLLCLQGHTLQLVRPPDPEQLGGRLAAAEAKGLGHTQKQRPDAPCLTAGAAPRQVACAMCQLAEGVGNLSQKGFSARLHTEPVAV